MLVFEIPVSPDAEEARRAAREELSKAIYNHQPGVISRVMRWLSDRLAELFNISPTSTSPWLSVIVLGLLIVALLISLVFFTWIRSNRRALADRAKSATLFADNADSATLAARAAQFASAGNFTEAFREQFRFLIRFADERALIADQPGMTAQEAATALAQLDHDYATSVRSQADLFDAASYGDLFLTSQHYEALMSLINLLRPRLAAMSPLVDTGEPSPGGKGRS
ncbi:hypothetical protein BSZ39_01250 [Bowdeniella nasicola]|uniref:Protein-glutamine gamma-glutamyltransferase-like C-terminal domain-containing protein n=1 Tax=Bowdeniella nasicola TaxID=208480 RepID=A0A1Q5Q5F0_9ACTO|nr:DUF4129 domain-containing protein [Bowdeniella nasicola]OKL54932.1 hypothetical protein BSZ39_01250 [Bowdeniella nasicola]